MAEADTKSPPAERPSRWGIWARPVAIGLLFLGLNVAVYLLLQTVVGREALHRLGDLSYLGVFFLLLLANATVIVPVPYAGVLVAVAQAGAGLPGIVLAGALGSALGESVAFFVGRSGRGAVEDTRFYRWVHRQLQHPARAWIVLFLLSAPPNPLFDVAGLTAGAVGIPYWMFFTSVFLGRIIRVSIFVLAGLGLAAGA